MLNFLKKKIFGTHSEHQLKRYRHYLPNINALEQKFSQFTKEECRNHANFLREQATNGTPLEALLPEAFALTRQAAMITIGQRHYDAQMLGAMALHFGQIAEMKTGEGKTLTSTLPVFLNSLAGKGIHVVTVNEYLAKRDSEWMGEIYKCLGMTVGLIQHSLDDTERRTAYAADVTYGTNNEFGFDYLRDNMKFRLAEYAQRNLNYAIVDEIDSILIDEARTPLIISGPSEISTEKYTLINRNILGLKRGFRIGDNPDIQQAAQHLNIAISEYKDYIKEKKEYTLVIPGDYALDNKSRNIQLTEQGVEKIQERLATTLGNTDLYDMENSELVHHINQALKAHYVFKKDIDYVVDKGVVKIVDEFTGRIMEGRRFSEGLHQALEAKEGVTIEKENQTLATITFQNYFRKYSKLAGMTGTAATEAVEFSKIYNLGVVEVPTHRPMNRVDHADVIYKTQYIKYKSIVDQIQALHLKKQPVLVGTDSIESSEYLSTLLKQQKINHHVLNAKHHEREAEIIAAAGEPESVTIATNMAGRGTDIKLGSGVKELGGLFILGTLRHESRRVDNQLRGRSGRQGDPGESRFYLSLEDNLLKNFGGNRIANLMDKLSMEEDEAIEHVLVTKAIENSQKKVEAHNFSIRKHLLEYDDVLNRQREAIYLRRRRILDQEDENVLLDMSHEVVDELLNTHCEEGKLDEWDLETLVKEVKYYFDLEVPEFGDDEKQESDHIETWIHESITAIYETKQKEFGPHHQEISSFVLIRIADNFWKEHLLAMDHLKDSVGLRGFAQKNPLDEYKKDGFRMFEQLMSAINRECVRTFFNTKLVVEEHKEIIDHPQEQPMEFHRGETDIPSESQQVKTNIPIVKKGKIGRNEPCPCGSGKKFKHCDCGWKKSVGF